MPARGKLRKNQLIVCSFMIRESFRTVHIHVLSGTELGSTKKAVFSDWVRRKGPESFISNDVQALFFLPSPER